MIMQMDKMFSPSPGGRAQHLLEKNIELENKRRKSSLARVPSDPNAWQQIRENYEAIILEDHEFSEKHNIQYALWQLHYKRIEEFRSHLSAALASTSSNAPSKVKGFVRPDRVTKIRLQFKTFLSEGTGFYHDMISKIRAKYGLPLGYFCDDSDNQIVKDKDGKKSTDMKKGLISCHRCWIYLGDLVRYKGLYGQGDSKNREYAAASSYYLQAASILPSSGNPHHQLAILASYSGNELVAVYRYFRSLAVESPFSTARDNLIVAFEKNRQSYSQLPGEVKASLVKDSSMKLPGKGRGKGEPRQLLKEAKIEACIDKEKVSSIPENFKTFCIRFIRLNGILFTRTSLEMFSEVLTLVSSGLNELLSSGLEEKMNFGVDASENALFVVRLVSILIFTVHNSKKETKDQTYAEIVQQAVIFHNAFTAVFELMGYFINRCVQLDDPSSSYLLPGILVFVEWLACCPDVSTGSDVNENQATVRSTLWKHCINFFNKILSSEPMFIDDNEDETCFFNMSRYDEGETENRLALFEDFELRGFLPLIPAQTLLDFSRKQSFGSDGNKEKNVRVKRIFAAGKALANMIKVDSNTVYFDSKMKNFIVGVEPSDAVVFSSHSVPPIIDVLQDSQYDETINLAVLKQNPQVYVDEEDEDEVIVFKPVVSEKRFELPGKKYPPFDGLKKPDHTASRADLHLSDGFVLASVDNLCWHGYDESTSIPLSVGNSLPQNSQAVQSNDAVNWLPKEVSLARSFMGLNVIENGHLTDHELPGNRNISYLPAHSIHTNQSFNVGHSRVLYGQATAPYISAPSKAGAVMSSGVTAETLTVKTSSALPASVRKNPVSRPVRHIGPPPGFNNAPQKQVNETDSCRDVGDNLLMDDYSWLDGYQPPSSKVPMPSRPNLQYIINTNGLNEAVAFPFPGKQLSTVQRQVDLQKDWVHYQALELLKQQHEQQLQQQPFINGNQQLASFLEQQQGQSVWMGRSFV